MSKLIIWISGRPITHGYVQREFKWSEPHKRFIYLGRELTDTEFNAVWEKAYRNNSDLNPQPIVVSAAESGPASPAAPQKPAPSRELTLDEALETVKRLAPNLLKAKPGPRPPTVEIS